MTLHVARWDTLDSRYYRTWEERVRAIQMRHDFTVDTPDGVVNGVAGDYIIEAPLGARLYMSRMEFEAKYVPTNQVNTYAI